MALRTTLLAAISLLLQSTIADPPNGGNRGPQAPDSVFAWSNAFPSCVGNCRPSTTDLKILCANSDALENLKRCVDESPCDDGQRDQVAGALAQWCVNAGDDLAGGPLSYLRSSVTSGGSAYPTNVAGWHNSASGYGPFGVGHGPNGRGWGASNWASGGDWTTGPWTKWWAGGDGGCPGSDWPGWTRDNSDWTSWTACTATTTGSAVVVETVTGNAGALEVVTTTSFGVKVAQRTGGMSGDGDGGGVLQEGKAVGRAVGAGVALAVTFGVVVTLL